MPEMIGVRELKNKTSQVIRAVSEGMVEYVVTLRGEPVAMLCPLTAEELEQLRLAGRDEALAQMKKLAREVSAAWVSGKSGVECFFTSGILGQCS